jgi:serine/threonine protein kinase
MNKAIDNYVLKEIVGEGQYGKVYKAFNTQTYGLYAVKVIRMDKFK